MKTKIFLLLIFIGFVNISMLASKGHSQTKEQEDVYWKAIKYYQVENYAKAVLMFEYLLDMDSENGELNYYTGMCFLNLNKPKLAKWYFSKASEDSYSRLKVLYFTKIQGYSFNDY